MWNWTGKAKPHIKTLKINPFIISAFLQYVPLPKVERRKSAVSITKAQQLQRQKQRLWTTIDPLPMQPHSHHYIFYRGDCLSATFRLERRNRDICRHYFNINMQITFSQRYARRTQLPLARQLPQRDQSLVSVEKAAIWRIVKGWSDML